MRHPTYPHHQLSGLEISLVAVVLGLVAAVAVPQYLDMRQHASDDSARSLLGHATRSLASRHAVAGTYAGAILPAGVRVKSATRGSYCVETTAGERVWHASGPKATARSGGC